MREEAPRRLEETLAHHGYWLGGCVACSRSVPVAEEARTLRIDDELGVNPDCVRVTAGSTMKIRYQR